MPIFSNVVRHDGLYWLSLINGSVKDAGVRALRDEPPRWSVLLGLGVDEAVRYSSPQRPAATTPEGPANSDSAFG